MMTPTMKYYRLAVTGRGTFPYDMLRYGQCFPECTSDAHNLEPDAREPRTIQLGCYATSALHMQSTVDRFASFMWTAEVVQQ